MERSLRLGPCVCDPRKPCPCPLFTERDVCQCAGETLEPAPGPVRLTQLVENAGCASKIDQATLKRIVGNLPFREDPRVLLGAAAGDDAGVYRLDDRQALVQTVDVFTPCVDDPYTFGQVAATNSVSDIYAMGGTPITALSIIGFPGRELPDDVMREILRGGLDKMAEAGVAVIGGHSINEKEIKAGFAVTGLIDVSRVVARAGARPGDVLVLTKPIGTGVIAFAAQIGRAPKGTIEAAARSMTALNKTAAEWMLRLGAHACTDVTGFSLLGHLAEMARDGGVDVRLEWDDLPLLPGVLECAAEGMLSGAVERNRESVGSRVVAGKGVEPLALDICFDPQTSGGLLIAVAGERAGELVKGLREAGVGDAAIVGRVTGKGEGSIRVETRGARRLPKISRRPTKIQAEEQAMKSKKTEHRPCCAGGAPAEAGGSPAGAEAQKKFMEFLAAATRPGALDARTKQALAIALSVITKCEPCTKTHVAKARQMGMSEDEIGEAAWMAIAFGGSPVWKFWTELAD